MDSTAATSPLEKISGNRYFVLGAYFFAFFPWAVMSNIDFITEKWRTVRQTRKLAYVHMLGSIVPLVYVAVYAEAQRQAKDEKELGAALAALMFNLLQFFRTVMGKAQLDAFTEWCKHAVECLQALHSDEEDIEYVEEKLKVNNNVIDNELGGRDVTVVPSWKKMWDGFKRGEFKPSKWLTTPDSLLSTVRWSGAYLCAMGESWGVSFGFHGEALKILATFFSREFIYVRAALSRVSWKMHNENDQGELVSLDGIGETELSGEMNAAYGSEILGFRAFDTLTVDSYSFEFDSLVSSYPSTNEAFTSGNRERVSVGLVQSVLVAKHLGIQKLKAIRRNYDEYRIFNGFVFQDAFKLLLMQEAVTKQGDSEIFEMFGLDNNVPLFPYRMQMIALWEHDTNWRILQASAHSDIKASFNLYFHAPFEDKPDAMSVFDFCANIAQEYLENDTRLVFLGAVLETVRTLLAEWLEAGAREVEWEPAIPEDSFEFDISGNIYQPQTNFIDTETLIWMSQRALQKEASRISKDHQNLASSHVLIMLFLLGMPGIGLEMWEDDAVNEQFGERNDVENVNGNDAAVSSTEQRLNVSVKMFRFRSNVLPQRISTTIRVDVETRRASLQLENYGDSSHFKWQDWIDAAMGLMKGMNERRNSIAKCKQPVRRADLEEPMVEACVLRSKNEGGVEETGTMRVWMGWPPFEVKICKFEIEQWLESYHSMSSDGSSNWDSVQGYELDNAERLIEGIVSANVRGITG